MFELGQFVKVSKQARKVKQDLRGQVGQIMQVHWGFNPCLYTLAIAGKEYALYEDEIEKFQNPLKNA